MAEQWTKAEKTWAAVILSITLIAFIVRIGMAIADYNDEVRRDNNKGWSGIVDETHVVERN